MKTSSLFSLDVRDAAKGLIVAAGGAAVSAIEASINAGSLTFNWKQISLTALAAGLAYLGKNFFTPAKIIHTDGAK